MPRLEVGVGQAATARTGFRTAAHDTRSAERGRDAAARSGIVRRCGACLIGRDAAACGGSPASPAAALVGAGRVGRPGRSPTARSRPEPPSVAGLAASAGRSSRRSCCRCVAVAVAWIVGRPPGRRARIPTNPVPRVRTVAFLGGARRDRDRAPVRDRALRHDAVLGPHGPAHPAHARRRAAHRPRRAGHARSSASRRRASARRVAPADPPLAARCGCSPSRSSPGSLFAAVMWATHFSPLFDLALENRFVHDLEHVLFLGAALLFWWPAVGLDPAPWRLSPPGAGAVRLPPDAPEHVPRGRHPQRAGGRCTRTTRRSPGRGARRRSSTSRRPAGSCGSPATSLFIAAIAAILAGWMRARGARTRRRADRQADVERAAIRARGVAPRGAAGRGARPG